MMKPPTQIKQIIRRLLIYLLGCIVLFGLLLYYLTTTDTGRRYSYHSLERIIEKKSHIPIKIEDITLRNFPKISINVILKHRYHTSIQGKISRDKLNLVYTIQSECIESHLCLMNDEVDIQGEIKGPRKNFTITGSGKALEGKIEYRAIKIPKGIENLHLSAHQINALKLFSLFNLNPYFKGKANIQADFSIIKKDQREGALTYDVEDKNFYGLPVKVHTQYKMKEQQIDFLGTLTAPAFKLDITKGHYNAQSKTAYAFYLLNAKDLRTLQPLLRGKYEGVFYSMGEINYAHKALTIEGLSKSYGGLLAYLYEPQKDLMTLDFDNVSLIKILNIFDLPPIVKADVVGKLTYEFDKNLYTLNTKLNDAQIVQQDLIDVVYDKVDVNLALETFDNSFLNLTYQNNILLGDLKLENDTGHLLLTDTQINTKEKNIDAFFDFKVQKQEFSGSVYGSLEHTKVDLDVQRLIRFQMEKQLDRIIGANSAIKMMRKMPMEDVAEDMATGTAASFIKAFF